MEYVTLGRTGLRVSRLGLGGGGHSRLGQRFGATPVESVRIVRRALELGVNFVDMAEAYGTEAVVGVALRDAGREQVILSTKKSITDQERLITADELAGGLEASLKRLGTEYVDVYHLHGVREDQYDHARTVLVPALMQLRDHGKIRFLGITEAFAADPGHGMLARAVRDEPWDVVMVGFNILNQSARARVFAETIRRNTGVLCMFAVRNALRQLDTLRQAIGMLVDQGLIDRHVLDLEDPLGFALQAEGVEGLPDAAYRFCGAEPGIHVVLSGTGNIQHLEQNVRSILSPPLPDDVRQKIVDSFAHVDTISGQ